MWWCAGHSCDDHKDWDGLIDGEDHAIVRVVVLGLGCDEIVRDSNVSHRHMMFTVTLI